MENAFCSLLLSVYFHFFCGSPCWNGIGLALRHGVIPISSARPRERETRGWWHSCVLRTPFEQRQSRRTWGVVLLWLRCTPCVSFTPALNHAGPLLLRCACRHFVCPSDFVSKWPLWLASFSPGRLSSSTSSSSTGAFKKHFLSYQRT